MDVAQASSGCGREREELASHVFEVIEVHSSDDFLESPVKFGWVRVRTCHVENGNWTSEQALSILGQRQRQLLR